MELADLESGTQRHEIKFYPREFGTISLVGAGSRELTAAMVLLQWYYLTANSCKHVGYDTYEWPEEWGEDVKLYKRLPDCEEVPADGNGVPEQFW